MHFPSSSSAQNNEEFLPAALEILEHPPSPLGRLLIIAIAALFTAIIFWAWVGKVDVVVVGQGKVIPSSRVQPVQTVESGVVSAILVQEGQYVVVGDALVELDATQTETQLEHLEEQRQNVMLELASAKALLTEYPMKTFIAPDGVPDVKAEHAANQVAAVYFNFQASLNELQAEEDRIGSKLRSIEIEIARINEVLPLLRERLASAGTLLSRDARSRDDRLAMQQSYIEMEASRQSLLQSKEEMSSSLRALDERRNQTRTSFEISQRATALNARAQIAEINGLITSEALRRTYSSIIAPTSGYVDQLQTYTIGGVLNPGETIMNIVPRDGNREFEAYILNKDIGFISTGDAVEIKLESFPFTRFGVLDGIVTKLSNDAIQHDQLGLVYKVSAQLETSQQTLDESGISIVPGMNATLEILADRRRIIDYFISPLLRYKDEAIRER